MSEESMVSQVREIFEGLLENLKVDNSTTLANRRDEITRALNHEFRGIEGSTANKLMVGSYGRWTAIKGISDLDLLYILPASLRATYEKDGGPSKVLTRVRKAVEARYPTTTVKVDRLVVVVQFANFMFEVQPVFENDDESFSYPDTSSDSWKVTKPRLEMTAMRTENALTKDTLRQLCKLTRAWKNKHGVAMGGLLIDTLAYKFVVANAEYRSADSGTYDEMVRDFFLYLSEEEDHEFYAALGSGQRVRVKKKFQRKSKKAYNLCIEAISAAGQKNAYKKWRAVFGNSVPIVDVLEASSRSSTFTDTEEFIEDVYPVDVRYSITIDCTVTQDGFRPQQLRTLLALSRPLPAKKKLNFAIVESDVSGAFEVRWKVVNRGYEAERRNNIRGEIVKSTQGHDRRETTSFRGHHEVECYIVQNGVVVARDEIEVPIAAG
jgi:hypothetical protein